MPPPLTVAFLSHLASRRAPTGAEHSLRLLAEGIAARGHRVVVVTPGAWALASALAASGIEVVRLHTRACWMTYAEPIPVWRAVAKAARYAMPDPGGPRLERLLRTLRPDVVHVNCLPHVRGARAARRAGRPTIWHVREILPPGPRRRWFATVLRDYAATIVAVSEAVGSWLREEGLGDRLRVVPNGAMPPDPPADRDEARRGLGLPVDGLIVGLYGQIAPHKGAGDFLQAAAIARRREPRLVAVLAGTGPERYIRTLRAASAEEGTRGGVRILPPEPSSERLLAATDIVALTTRTPDPFPRSVLEGMAAGLPVVAYRSGGTAEMVADGETGWLVPTGDVDGLAEALLKLAFDPAERARMGAAGRSRVLAKFSAERHVDRMEALLREAAGR